MAELKRGNVVRVGIAYAVNGRALAQVAVDNFRRNRNFYRVVEVRRTENARCILVTGPRVTRISCASPKG